MPRTILRGLAITCLGVFVAAGPTTAPADEAKSSGHHPTSRRDAPAPDAARGTGSSGGFWLGTTGVAVALAAFGAVSLGARKLRPGGDAGSLKVVGRASLSPRHTVYLLRAGDRVLIVGAGSQGPPSLLGEMTPEEAGVSTVAVAVTPAAPHRDRAVGPARRIGEPA